MMHPETSLRQKVATLVTLDRFHDKYLKKIRLNKGAVADEGMDREQNVAAAQANPITEEVLQAGIADFL